MKKQGITLILATALAISTLTGCGNTQSTNNGGNTDSAQESSSADGDYKFGKIDIPALDGSLCGAPIYIAYEKGFFAEPEGCRSGG